MKCLKNQLMDNVLDEYMNVTKITNHSGDLSICLDDFPNLKTIDIDGNVTIKSTKVSKLRSVRCVYFECYTLEFLELAYLEFSMNDNLEIINVFPNLTDLHLNNMGETITIDLDKLPNLETLNLGYNNLIIKCTKMSKLRIVRCHGYVISCENADFVPITSLYCHMIDESTLHNFTNLFFFVISMLNCYHISSTKKNNIKWFPNLIPKGEVVIDLDTFSNLRHVTVWGEVTIKCTKTSKLIYIDCHELACSSPQFIRSVIIWLNGVNCGHII